MQAVRIFQRIDLQYCEQVSDAGLRPLSAGFPGIQHINVASAEVPEAAEPALAEADVKDLRVESGFEGLAGRGCPSGQP